MSTSNAASNDGSLTTVDTPENIKSKPLTPDNNMDNLLKLDMSPITSLKDGKQIRIPKNPNFSRKDVVNAFQSAFELVGGVPRLAIWADSNYTEFTKLYARLLPSQSNSALGEANVLRIEMAISPSALDDLPVHMQPVEKDVTPR